MRAPPPDITPPPPPPPIQGSTAIDIGRLVPFNWGFLICLQKLCLSLLHPMPSSGHWMHRRERQLFTTNWGTLQSTPARPSLSVVRVQPHIIISVRVRTLGVPLFLRWRKMSLLVDWVFGTSILGGGDVQLQILLSAPPLIVRNELWVNTAHHGG